MGLWDNISVYAEHIPFSKVTHTKKGKTKPKDDIVTLYFQVKSLFLKALFKSSVLNFSIYWKLKLGDFEQHAN